MWATCKLLVSQTNFTDTSIFIWFSKKTFVYIIFPKNIYILTFETSNSLHILFNQWLLCCWYLHLTYWMENSIIAYCPISWSCRIYWLLLCRGVRWVSWYDTKQSYGKIPISWSFGEYRVLLHCNHSQVYSGPEW